MAAPQTYPLGQLVDLLPMWGWNVLMAGGLLAPLVGLLISLAAKSLTRWKRFAVAVFYAFSLPLAGLVVLGHAEDAVSVCSFLLLMPVGMGLGLAVLAPRGCPSEQRGFEVQFKDKVA